jgi:hypothetical protein
VFGKDEHLHKFLLEKEVSYFTFFPENLAYQYIVRLAQMVIFKPWQPALISQFKTLLTSLTCYYTPATKL